MAVLFLANTQHPDYVALHVGKTSSAKRLLGPELGSAILEPLASGTFGGRSFVAWPWCRSLSQSRPVRYAQKYVLVRRVLSWLRCMTSHTKACLGAEHRAELYDIPLQRLAADPRFDRPMREMAQRASDGLAAGFWHPYSVLEHHDFGLWNMLLPCRRTVPPDSRARFFVTDWGDSSPVGRAFCDLVYFCSGLNAFPVLLRTEIIAHCGMLGCTPNDAMFYLLAGLWANETMIGRFPMEQYLEACRRTFSHLREAIDGMHHGNS